MDVLHEGRTAAVPRPSLLASLVLKAAAVGVDTQPARHLRDLAFLCALVPDPFDLRAAMTAKDCQRLRTVRSLLDRGHTAWALVPAPLQDQGHEALTLLLDEST